MKNIDLLSAVASLSRVLRSHPPLLYTMPDYSRWDNLEVSDDEDEAAQREKAAEMAALDGFHMHQEEPHPQPMHPPPEATIFDEKPPAIFDDGPAAPAEFPSETHFPSELPWTSPVIWIAAAWLIGSVFGSGDGAFSVSIPSMQDPTTTPEQPTMPENHPPVPRGARDLCSAALEAAKAASRSERLQAWIFSPTPAVLGTVTAVVTAIVVIIRILVERKRACERVELLKQRAAKRAAAMMSGGPTPPPAPSFTSRESMEAWVAANCRAPTAGGAGVAPTSS